VTEVGSGVTKVTESPLGEIATQIMHVEFFGVPRQRAGISNLEVHANTLGHLLGTLAAQIPSLGELISVDRLNSSFIANLNGDRFVSDPGTPLSEDDRILILSADAGG
jgi:molybdopterin converting factor small subunit